MHRNASILEVGGYWIARMRGRWRRLSNVKAAGRSMTEEFEQLARDLARAWRTGGAVPLPAAGDGPRTRLEAYAVQDRMAALIGGSIAGWKVGATVRAEQLFQGHDGPLPGRLFADRCFPSPARVPANWFHGVKVECEFAFRLTREL